MPGRILGILRRDGRKLASLHPRGNRSDGPLRDVLNYQNEDGIRPGETSGAARGNLDLSRGTKLKDILDIIPNIEGFSRCASIPPANLISREP